MCVLAAVAGIVAVATAIMSVQHMTGACMKTYAKNASATTQKFTDAKKKETNNKKKEISKVVVCK